MISIFKMTPIKIKECAALESQCFSEPWNSSVIRDEMTNPYAHFIYASINQKFVGYASFLIISEEAEILRICVDPRFQKQGIGSELMKAIITQCQLSQCNQIYLEVRESNINAIKLYQNFNFIQTGLRKDYYDNPTENALLFECRL